MKPPITSDSLLSLIQERRTCYQFEPLESSPVSDKELYTCLEAARWAPNHKLTQPWRFWIIEGKSKQDLAHIYADNRALKRAANEASLYEGFYEKAFRKFLDIPRVVLVGQVLDVDPITQKEDYAACACAIQNFQLMAWQQTIGVQWSTGPILSDKRTYERLEVDSKQIELIGALYLGHIKAGCNHPNPKRKPLDQVVSKLN
ncbi:MAG: nitroreductase [Pseudomonadota bacterium]|nr:nitroreductase [Pseudomonadota bacterium]